jgi:arylsulfatase A-like enzyme
MLALKTLPLRLATLALVLGAACTGPPASERRPQRPDLILVIIDTWRWDALGANGSARPEITPSLDGLARRGARFSRAFASSPWTMTSVASILTGHSPTVHGAFGRLDDVSSIRPEISTVAQRLSDGGYRTLGVVNAPFLDSSLGFDRGFDSYDYHPSSNRHSRRAGEATDVALRLLRESGTDGDPVFLLLHLFDPHLSYDPPPPWNRRWTGSYDGRLRPHRILASEMRRGSFHPSSEDLAYVRALYDGEVAYTDRALGAFFDRLETEFGTRDRWIVITSDHGEELGDHQGWEHGHSMYRELIQVPLIVVPPASSQPSGGVVVDTQVRLVDIMPTLLEVAGIEPASSLEGRSLLPLMRGDAPARDRPAYSEEVHLGIPSKALREEGLTLIVFEEDRPPELYDQLADPAEGSNLAASRPERVGLLTQRLRTVSEFLDARAAALGSPRKLEELDPELEEQLRALGYLGGG